MSEVSVRSAIGGSVWQIKASVGDRVEEDDTIMIMESMKMEIPVNAPCRGTVKSILVETGQVVAEDDVVALIETE
jgi:acetyl-CoA carboxylase biotin carboxyl carrier protein